MKSKEIELHIKQLVLHGFSTADKYHIGVAMKRELTRLMNRQGFSAVSSGVVSVDASSFTATANATPEHIGSRVAECVYRGFSR